MTVNQVIHHFAAEKIKAWLARHNKGIWRGKMILGMWMKERDYLALPITFKTDVMVEYTPVFQASLN